MSNEKDDFSLENILKKVQDGDTTLLIVAAIMVIIPAIFLIFLVGDKTDKKVTQQKFRSMTQRRNVFNFTSKTGDGKTSTPKSSLPSANSNWFGAKTPEQQIGDELESARKKVERSLTNIVAPDSLEPEAKMQYEAEHNYNLCLAHGAMEIGNYKEAEEYLLKALNDANNKDNYFLTVYAYSALCSVYEAIGDLKKLEEVSKKYIESVERIPPEYGGGDLKTIVRNAYQSLQSLSNYSDQSKFSEALSKELSNNSNTIPSESVLKGVYKSFPIKYE